MSERIVCEICQGFGQCTCCQGNGGWDCEIIIPNEDDAFLCHKCKKVVVKDENDLCHECAMDKTL